ncbi:C6 transcription factor [Bisporella sp. PMI_857]|nr:C6 transcription factor [Bisporella sp. PMI_857]
MPIDSGENYSSCDACRARKYKCSKEQPACKSCGQHGWQCKYSPKVSRTALTRSNLSAAEDRVRELEAILSSLLPNVNLGSAWESIKQDGTIPNQQAMCSTPQLGRTSLPDQPELGKAVESGIESLPREADGFDWAEREVTFGGLSDGMAALSILPDGAGYLGATSSVAPLRALLNTGQSTSDKIPSQGSSTEIHLSLPERISPNTRLSSVPENSFIDAYFHFYHTTYPFLHEPTFRAQFNGTYPRPEGYSWFMLLNTVLALGAWCIGDDQFSMDDYFYKRLPQVAGESSVFETGNLALVQALLLLSNYTQKRNRPNTGWNYLGLAVRTAVSLGLHKEFSHWDITPLQREMRRRVWWGVFIFDSGASITFGRPVLLPNSGIMDASEVLNIHEKSLTRISLAPPDETDAPTVYTGLIAQSQFHVQTNRLYHRLISCPKPSIQEILGLQKTIDEWEDLLPSYFQPNSFAIQSHQAYVFARYRLSWRSWNLRIVLLRPILLRWSAKQKAEDSHVPETEEEANCRLACLQHARSTISSISNFMSLDINSRLSTWYMLYFLFQAGLIPIICLMTDPANDDAQAWLNDILTTRDLITRTATNNSLATRCLDIFNQLCSPVFDAPVPEDVLQNPELFDAGFLPHAGDGFGMLDFWDWQKPILE